MVRTLNLLLSFLPVLASQGCGGVATDSRAPRDRLAQDFGAICKASCSGLLPCRSPSDCGTECGDCSQYPKCCTACQAEDLLGCMLGCQSDVTAELNMNVGCDAQLLASLECNSSSSCQNANSCATQRSAYDACLQRFTAPPMSKATTCLDGNAPGPPPGTVIPILVTCTAERDCSDGVAYGVDCKGMADGGVSCECSDTSSNNNTKYVAPDCPTATSQAAARCGWPPTRAP